MSLVLPGARLIQFRPSRRAPIGTRALRSAMLLVCLALGLALEPGAPPAASAATLMVVGDTNAAPAANMPLYTNFLGAATSVLFSRDSTAQTRLWSDYRARPGVTVAQSAAPLTAAALAAVDLLVLSAVYDTA